MKVRPMSSAAHVMDPSPQKGPQLVEKPVERELESPLPGDPLERLHWLPCTLTLELQVARFTVADLLQLGPGSIVQTGSHQTSDLPLRVNGRLMGWTEFEVVNEHLAVRLTDLA